MVNGQKAPVSVAERIESTPRRGLLDHEYRYGVGFLAFVALVGVMVLTFVVGMLLGILYL